MAFVIIVAVALVASIVSIINSIDMTILTMYGYQRYFAVVTPRNVLSVSDEIANVIQSEPLKADMFTARPAFTQVKTVFGKMPFVVFGISPYARERLIQRLHLRLVSGRLPQEGEPEITLSAEIARNRRLKLGDPVLSPDSEDSYSLVPAKLVGTFEGPVWLAITSEVFIQKFFPVAPQGYIITAREPGKQHDLDSALERDIDNAKARVWTHRRLVRETHDALSSLYLIMSVVIGIIVFAIAFLTGMLTNIYFTQRLPEFATLSAIGYPRSSLLARVLGETGLLCLIGWALGALLTIGLLYSIKVWIMAPRGLLLDPLDLSAYRMTIPFPVTIAAFALFAVGMRLRRLDPVSIIERRQ